MKIKGATGAEAMLRLLSSMGVEFIFASPGSEWAPVWEALANPDLKDKPMYLSARHEEIAVGMASGYAKSTGKLPAVMVHTSVGSLHASMALRGALHENVPMVVLTGKSIAFGKSPGPDLGAHWLSQLADIGGPARLVERCVKWSLRGQYQSGVSCRDPACVPACDDRSQRPGICFLALGVSVRRRDD